MIRLINKQPDTYSKYFAILIALKCIVKLNIQIKQMYFNLSSRAVFASILLGLYTLFKNKNKFKAYIQSNANRLMLLSFCLILPLAITLSFAINQHNWYMAPIFMFPIRITILCARSARLLRLHRLPPQV